MAETRGIRVNEASEIGGGTQGGKFADVVRDILELFPALFKDPQPADILQESYGASTPPSFVKFSLKLPSLMTALSVSIPSKDHVPQLR